MRKLIIYGIILFQLILIASLVKGLQVSSRAKVRLTDLEKDKQKLMEANEQLKKEEEYVKSEYYLEKIAREELHLSKPGETVVIIPDGVISENKKQIISNIEIEKKNWQKWWDILRGQNEREESRG